MKKLLLVLVLICVLLGFTNPSKDDFKGWVSNKIKREAETELDAFVGSVIGVPIMDLATTRDDYILFSVYKVETGSGDKSVILGILKQFIVVNE